MRTKRVQTDKWALTVIEPGIIRLSMKENTVWTLEDAKATHLANLKLCNGGKYTIYMNINRFFVPTQEAQRYISSKKVTKHRVAAAFVTRNRGLKIFANLFIRFFKSTSPSRLFTNEKKAIRWLREKYKVATRK